MNKKLFLLICVSGFCLMTLSAQENAEIKPIWNYPKHTVQLGVADQAFVNSLWGYYGINTVKTDWFSADLYCEGLIALPTFSLGYHYSILKWLQVGAIFTYAGQYGSVRERITNSYVSPISQNMLTLMSSVNFTYLNRKSVVLYSGLSLGVGYRSVKGFDQLPEYQNMDSNQWLPAFQLTYFGVRWGKTVVGFAELGLGYKGFFNVGIAGRF